MLNYQKVLNPGGTIFKGRRNVAFFYGLHFSNWLEYRHQLTKQRKPNPIQGGSCPQPNEAITIKCVVAFYFTG
jgi:hypothetical protein